MGEASFVEVVRRVLELKGLSVLRQSGTFVACVADVAEQRFQREVRVLSRNIDDSALSILYEGASNGDQALRIAAGRLLCMLRDEYFISEDIALSISSDLAKAVGAYLGTGIYEVDGAAKVAPVGESARLEERKAVMECLANAISQVMESMVNSINQVAESKRGNAVDSK